MPKGPRLSVLTAVVAAALAVGGAALADAAFSDAVGDNNEAPDITSVDVSEAPDGMLTVRANVANFQALPQGAYINLWFDLDNNTRTGEEGDEANVIYEASGVLDFYRWNGRELARVATTGLTAGFTAGVFTFTAPKAAFGNPTSFGLLVVTSRPNDDDVIASDFASEQSRLPYVSPGPMSFPDPAGDQDAAPDITAVNVSDGKDGWITIRVTVANLQALPPDRHVAIWIDRDRKPSTGDDGAEVFLEWAGGERSVLLERWDGAEDEWVKDGAPTRALGSSANGIVTLVVHRSELADVSRFGFQIAAADFTGPRESVFEEADELEAVDWAPERGSWQYALVNKPPVHLVPGIVTSKPGRPVHGRRFTITVPVRRSDTLALLRSGKVTCIVRTGLTGVARLLPATGRFRNGRAECTLLVPPKSAGNALFGQVTIRALNVTGVAKFTYDVR